MRTTEELCPMDGFPVSDCFGYDCKQCAIYQELTAKEKPIKQLIPANSKKGRFFNEKAAGRIRNQLSSAIAG